IEYADLNFDAPWLDVDVLVNERGLAKLPDVSIQYCEPARPATYLIGPGNHRRWEIMLLPGEDLQEMVSDEHVWRLLSRWITPQDATLWRRASYRFHALVAREWRHGRVFIAGDAAHQQPPFTGQGMCQGIRDVANLSWKLQLALRGRAGDGLLDTYGAERSTHVRRYTAIIKGLGELICERDPDAARARDRRLLAEAGGKVETTPRQHLLPPLETGLLSPAAHPANGTIFPQPRVRDGETTALLDSLAGTGFRLVLNGRSPLSRLPHRDLIDLLDATVISIGEPPGVSGALHVAECDGVVQGWFERYGCSAAIVRPDHYVYGVAGSAEALDDQLARLTTSISI
ncbi:MAG: FAD-dependent monooxygenase, partial [Phycisphaerales bacterium]|nr:FAD-dependent monooxygenase [Hyphomonadaceae bacterium]